ncbi:MAG: hypothetical protein GC159_00005 [Phycisphaera sp.]|nr:hypothetical protein [Phycisphaera sp.]
MPLPALDELIAAFDQQRQTDLGVAESALFKEHGLEALVPGMIEAFPHIRSAAGRNAILFWLVRFARKYPDVVELAKIALNDRAHLPRMQACAILAYSLRDDVVVYLEPLLKHRDCKTRDNAAAAIDAIKHQNHHYWFDREHTGKFFWTVNRDDERST